MDHWSEAKGMAQHHDAFKAKILHKQKLERALLSTSTKHTHLLDASTSTQFVMTSYYLPTQILRTQRSTFAHTSVLLFVL
jgi:hypothetical protein